MAECYCAERSTSHAECCYDDCHYAECCYDYCRYAEWRYAECHYAECRGARKMSDDPSLPVDWFQFCAEKKV